MNFYSVRELRSTSKDIWNCLDEGGEAVITNNGKPKVLMVSIADGDLENTVKAIRQAKAMLAFSGMRQRAAERGYMSDADIEAEIMAVREGK